MRKHIFGIITAMTVLVTPVMASADFSFADVEGIEFYFSSGVGAWDTHLTIKPDGSFSGNYHDSNMGETGEGYPGGTKYCCDFDGSFTEPQKVDDYTYVFELKDLDYLTETGSQEIKDQILYVYSDAYGLDDPGEFYMFLPGKPLDELPEEFRSWVGYYDLSRTNDTTLPFYGLYNENAKEGFSGYPVQQSQIAGIVTDAEEKSSALVTELEGGDLPQTQLNISSGELFQIWDDALNEIWAFLKNNLDTEAMEELTKEELSWIADKEADVKKQGSEFEGGSLQPYVENMAAYQWTRDRVYELKERFGAL